jgi:hypothetical protein
VGPGVARPRLDPAHRWWSQEGDPEIDVEPCPTYCDDLKVIAAILVLSVIDKAVTYLALLAGTRDRFAAMRSDPFMSPLGRLHSRMQGCSREAWL